MKKRGVLEVQMHWIFVVIAGALILAFFIGLVVRQRTVARIELVFDIENDLDLLISGAKATEGSISEIEIPKLQINFDCRDYWIEGQKKSFGAKPVFANDELIGDSILLWSLVWRMPFKVDTFLYITSPAIRFVFVGGPMSLYEDFPGMISKERVTDVSGLADNGNYKIKFIIFNQNPTSLNFPQWLRKYDVDLVAVYSDEKKLEYYDFDGNEPKLEGTTYYLGDESLFGSFFTDNVEDYNCIMDKAMAELNAVTQIYTEKIKILDDSNVCPLFYGDTNTGLFEELAAKTTRRFSQGAVDIDGIGNTADLIHVLNIDIQMQSCPPIY